MKRSDAIEAIENRDAPWDFVIIGGGATGLGTAVEAAARGYDPLLLEMHDFAKATSSRSTKLVHGGVRYLQQGNVSLVLEALQERGILQQNAPHLVDSLPFIVPNYDWWEGPYYGVGLKLYDLLAGRQNFGRSQNLDRQETLEQLPTLEPEGLRGGVIYYDGQFDDARLAVNLAQTAVDQGGTVVNYMEVTDLMASEGVVDGVVAECRETGTEYEIPARAVINATGIFTDTIRQMDDPDAAATLRPSQGAHIVLDKRFLPGDTAIMVPRTEDGRILFAIPWHDRVVVGTTETPLDEVTLEPTPTKEELAFLLEHAQQYLIGDPGPEDVVSAFAGIRPLVAPPEAADQGTAEISRRHELHISNSGLVTISGGKWTTYRQMAEETIDQAATLADLEERPSATRNLNIHGWHEHAEQFDDLAPYGSDALEIENLIDERPKLGEPLHDRLPLRGAQVVWAVREEMARTVEDVLSRRTRSLLFDAKASVEVAPAVAQIMAEERNRSDSWVEEQVRAFSALADGYRVSGRLDG